MSMREELDSRLKRDRQFMIDLDFPDNHVTVHDIERMTFPVYSREKKHKCIGQMSIRQFLEKFG